MKTHRTRLSAAAACSVAALLTAATPAVAADLTLNVSNIASTDGSMMIAVYDSKKGFDKKSTYRAINRRVEQAEMRVVLADMPAGEYAVMLFQDLDGNEKLDTNMLGIPKEPWSASLEGRSVFGPPAWSDVNFKIGEQNVSIKISLN
ncbi:MAG: DUF2141 domain-containing protein [Burkholderiaceae bacterium]